MIFEKIITKALIYPEYEWLDPPPTTFAKKNVIITNNAPIIASAGQYF